MRATKNGGRRWHLNIEEAHADRDRILWSAHWTTRLRKKLKVEAGSTVLKVTRWTLGGIVALVISAPFGAVGLLLGPTMVESISQTTEAWEVTGTGARIAGFVVLTCIFWVFCVVRSGDKAVEYAQRMWKWNSKLERQCADLDRRLRKIEEQPEEEWKEHRD